jgi:hypothetical protein
MIGSPWRLVVCRQLRLVVCRQLRLVWPLGQVTCW